MINIHKLAWITFVTLCVIADVTIASLSFYPLSLFTTAWLTCSTLQTSQAHPLAACIYLAINTLFATYLPVHFAWIILIIMASRYLHRLCLLDHTTIALAGLVLTTLHTLVTMGFLSLLISIANLIITSLFCFILGHKSRQHVPFVLS